MKYRRDRHSARRGRTITKLIARDGIICSLCAFPLSRKVTDPGDPMYITFDHVVPRSAGGLTQLSNLRLAHKLCNNERGADPILEEDES